MYNDLLEIKGSGTSFDRLIPISVSKAEKITKIVPSIPHDYIQFLLNIGAGELGDAAFMLYDGLVEPEEIYHDLSPYLDEVLLFGDDFQGFNMGFNTKDWSIVEVDPTNMQLNIIAVSFELFIRNKIKELSID